MKAQIYQINGKTCWTFTYHYIDDNLFNDGFDEIVNHFTGTTKEFKEMVIEVHAYYGADVWNITKRHATLEEYNYRLMFE